MSALGHALPDTAPRSRAPCTPAAAAGGPRGGPGMPAARGRPGHQSRPQTEPANVSFARLKPHVLTRPGLLQVGPVFQAVGLIGLGC